MTIKDILKTFDYCGLSYEILEVGEDAQVIITKHGGHVFGPFTKDCEEGIFWMPDSIKDPSEYKKLIEDRVWNTGGDRVWIAPEIQFNITDRSRFRETLNTPKTIDPGNFSMTRDGNRIYLEQSLSLESYNTVTGSMDLTFKRVILPALNPLRKLPDYEALMSGLHYSGFEQVLDLTGHSDEDIYAETWELLQIRPKGTLFIPMYYPVMGTDHYEPAGDHEYKVSNGVCLKITGDSRYKIAYKSAVLTGRFGYISDEKDGKSHLIIINYPNNPSAMYSEEPPTIPGDTGYSIHVYNDSGASGGFAEMECNFQTIGKPTGLDRAVDRLTKWIFTGNTADILRVAKVLLGYEGV